MIIHQTKIVQTPKAAVIPNKTVKEMIHQTQMIKLTKMINKKTTEMTLETKKIKILKIL